MYVRIAIRGAFPCSSSQSDVFRFIIFSAVLTIHRREESTVRELAERTLDEHLFEAYLLTVSAYSQTECEPQGGEEANAELDG